MSFEQMTVTSTDAYRCSECDSLLSIDIETEPMYECGSCGGRFTRNNSADGDSNRCPSCNLFSAKVSDLSCPECLHGELEEVEALICGRCEELFPLDASEHACVDRALEQIGR